MLIFVAPSAPPEVYPGLFRYDSAFYERGEEYCSVELYWKTDVSDIGLYLTGIFYYNPAMQYKYFTACRIDKQSKCNLDGIVKETRVTLFA